MVHWPDVPIVNILIVQRYITILTPIAQLEEYVKPPLDLAHPMIIIPSVDLLTFQNNQRFVRTNTTNSTEISCPSRFAISYFPLV